MSLERRDRSSFQAAGTTAAARVSKGLSLAAAENSRAEPGAGALPAIQAVAFDAYGTLLDVYSVASLAEKLFPGKGKDLSQIWRTKQLEYTWLRSLMGKHQDFWQVTRDALEFSCVQLGLDCTLAQRDRLMEAYDRLSVFPDARPTLEGLAPLPLAILSNGSPGMLRAAAKSSGIEGLLRHIISVEEVEVYKPDPRVYQLAVDRFNVADRRNIGFVSSNGWDAIGAKSFGFTVFWINRSGAPLDVLGVKPDRVLNALTDLIPLVKG